MTEFSAASLRQCIARYRAAIPELAVLPFGDSPASLVDSYDRCYPLLENAMWSGVPDFESLLDCYQALFREQDELLRQLAQAGAAADERYHFILSIPVADRPSHLRACLESIFQVCRRFGYGGQASGVYTHIKVIVAEDSRDAGNIRQHVALAEEYCARGLQVFHFGQDEQYELLQSIPAEQRKILGNVLTTQPRDRFFLKGQAANRNLSVLKCLQLTEDRSRTLYYFVDSDEAFCVNRLTGAGEETAYALNYFYCVDRIFRTTDTVMLTGKLVGDPPVSPAVMAANFLDDVTAYFVRLADLRGTDDCRFHDSSQTLSPDRLSGAAYHDMAGLFGFKNADIPYPYRCPLQGRHDHVACLRTFAGRLEAFFFGEHLTRKTFFSYGNGFNKRTPARTVYPGNYVVNYEGLKCIIPFGHLRLRMSGPTAGRLIAAEIHERFASANLPHLHRRTNEKGLGEAFRPGVEMAGRGAPGRIDLSSEFERQFFGDLMLFSTEALVAQVDIREPLERGMLMQVVERKESELLTLYRQKHQALLERIRRLDEFVFAAGHWWLEDAELAGALGQVRVFIDNIDYNFGAHSPAWRKIRSEAHRADRKQQIVTALMNYRTERNAWDSLF